MMVSGIPLQATALPAAMVECFCVLVLAGISVGLLAAGYLEKKGLL